MDIRVLQKMGLTDGEIKVYLALLKLGSTTSGPLTDESGVSRSKIYHVLERLVKKGLVSHIIKQKTRYFQAAEPSKLKEYIQKKKQEIEKQEHEIESLIPQLELHQKLGKELKEAQIFEGFKGIQAVNEHTYAKLSRGEEYVCLGIPAFQGKTFDLYWRRDHRRRAKEGIKCRMLYNQGTDQEILESRNDIKGCDARYMPIPLHTPAWFMVYKDTTAIILSSKEGIAIEIVNQDIAESFKAYFEEFWKKSDKQRNTQEHNRGGKK